MARTATKNGVDGIDALARVARVARVRESAAFGGDPLNLAKRKLKNAPEDFQRMTALRKAIKAKERVVGDGTMVSGTGLTVGKFRETTIARLISSGRIGPIELQALQEIDRVYMHMCKRLTVRGYEIKDKTSKSSSVGDPSWFLDAYYGRYKPWANDWSRRRVQLSDMTLEVVFDVMMSARTGKEIDAEHGWRHGMAIKVFINGLRDYAANAGWIGGATKARWQEQARAVFAKRRVKIRAAYLLAQATQAATPIDLA